MANFNYQQGDWYGDFDYGNQGFDSFDSGANYGGGHPQQQQHPYQTPYDLPPSTVPQTSYYGQSQQPYTSQKEDYGGQMFIPNTQKQGGDYGTDFDFEDEPPLLEELGINFDHIKQKTMTDNEKRRFYELAQKDAERYQAELAMYGEDYRKRKRQKKDPNAPKRALSAFFFFSQFKRPEIQQAHPDWRVGQIAQELGRRWKEFTPEEKQQYEEMASNDRERYEHEMKDYKAGRPVPSRQRVQVPPPQAADPNALQQHQVAAAMQQMAATAGLPMQHGAGNPVGNMVFSPSMSQQMGNVNMPGVHGSPGFAGAAPMSHQQNMPPASGIAGGTAQVPIGGGGVGLQQPNGPSAGHHSADSVNAASVAGLEGASTGMMGSGVAPQQSGGAGVPPQVSFGSMEQAIPSNVAGAAGAAGSAAAGRPPTTSGAWGEPSNPQQSAVPSTAGASQLMQAQQRPVTTDGENDGGPHCAPPSSEGVQQGDCESSSETAAGANVNGTVTPAGVAEGANANSVDHGATGGTSNNCEEQVSPQD